MFSFSTSCDDMYVQKRSRSLFSYFPTFQLLMSTASHLLGESQILDRMKRNSKPKKRTFGTTYNNTNIFTTRTPCQSHRWMASKIHAPPSSKMKRRLELHLPCPCVTYKGVDDAKTTVVVVAGG